MGNPSWAEKKNSLASPSVLNPRPRDECQSLRGSIVLGEHNRKSGGSAVGVAEHLVHHKVVRSAIHFFILHF